MKLFTRWIFWPMFFTAQLIASSLLAWHLLAQIDFAYPTGYKLLDLKQHIAEFAPQNRFKQGFEKTTPEQHWQLFSRITTAVQHHGTGLSNIRYTLPNGTTVPLMHEAEIIHLQDVSRLIDTFYTTGILCALLYVFLLLLAKNKALTFPQPKKILLGFFSGIFLLCTIILLAGATQVFYWFHTKIFPDGHQWFFYYEDSLMTTLMKAPDIFAFIALLLAIAIIVILSLSTGCSRALLCRPSKVTTQSKPTHPHLKIRKKQHR
jgi:hypothetical protein